MKKEIAFLILCIIALGFLLVRTLQEGRWSLRGFREPLKEEVASLVASIKKEDVTKIELRRPQDIVVFSRSADGLWKIINPIEAQADSDKLEEMLSLLATKDDPSKIRIPIGKEKDVQQAAMEAFGMGTPSLGLVFRGNFGEHSLWLGQKAPQDQGVYAHWTQERYIELVPESLVQLLSAPVEDLREMRVFHVPDAPISEVLLRKKGQWLQLLTDGRAILRSGEQDDGASEIVHKADPRARQELFDFLENVRCKDFWDNGPQILGRETLLKIRITRNRLNAPEETWVVEKVSTVEGEKWTVEGAPGKGKYVVDSEAFGKYLQDAGWLLDKRWTEVEAKDCDRLSFQGGGNSLTLERRDGVWQAPGEAGWRVDQAKTREFLRALFALKVSELVPCQEVAARGGMQLEVRDAKSTTQVTMEEHADLWTMHRKGDPFLFRLESPGIDFRACLDRSFWRDRSVVDWKASDLQEAALIRQEGTNVFVQKDGIWRLSAPRPGAVNQQAFVQALGELLPLEASRFLSPAETAAMGKFKLRLKVLLTADGKKRELWLGRPGPEGIPAKLAGDNDVFLLTHRGEGGLFGNALDFVTILEEDSNRNGKTDQWVHYSRGKRQWMESDADEDGTMDAKTTWRYNREGDLIRMDEDTQGDGRVDAWTMFVQGVQISRRLDTNGDGKPDKVIRRTL